MPMQEERIFFLKNAIEENPEDAFYRHALAMEYLEKQEMEAEKILSYNLINYPNYLPTYYMAANLYFNLGKYTDAEITFLKGIALATQQKNEKALKELKASYMTFKDEVADE